MRVYKGFNLTPTMSDLAPHRYEETKYYKKNDEIRRLLQTKPKALKSEFRSLFYQKMSNPKHKNLLNKT